MFKPNKADLIYNLLKERIASMADGEEFPSVRQLMKLYGASQFSVAPALKKLQEQGHLAAFVGRGAFVRKNPGKKDAKILVLSPDWPSLTVTQMRDAIAVNLSKRGFRPEIGLYSVDEDIYLKLRDFKVDGIILDPIRYDSFTAEQMNALAHLSTPIVLCRAKPPVMNLRYVNGNNTLAGVQIADHLYGKGHRKIGILVSEPRIGNTEDLMRGFLSQTARGNCQVEAIDCEVKLGENALEKARMALERRLAAGPPGFTALFAISYETALEALKLLKSRGVRVPEDLSVIAFGQLTVPGQSGLLPSSVGHSVSKIASVAVDLIEAQLNGDFLSSGQREIDPELFDNGSVADLSILTQQPAGCASINQPNIKET